MHLRSLFVIGSLGIALFSAETFSAHGQDGNGPVAGEALEFRTLAKPAAPTSNYLGWYVRWSVEGSCVGGETNGVNNPDAQDVWLKGDGVPDLYVTHLSHGTEGNCDDHLLAGINWDQLPVLQNSCDGGACDHYDGFYGIVQPHAHTPACYH